MTVQRESVKTPTRPLADEETLEILYHTEEDPAKKAVIRRQLEEMRSKVETR